MATKEEKKMMRITIMPHCESAELDGILSNHTMEDVRTLINEQFDDDMFPNGSKEYFFKIDDVRRGQKQERSIRAFDVLQNKQHVSIHDKNENKRPRDVVQTQSKRAKTNEISEKGSFGVAQDTEEDCNDDAIMSIVDSDDGVDEEMIVSSSSTKKDQPEASHKILERVVDQSCHVLTECRKIVNDESNAVFFADETSKAIDEEIRSWLDRSAPDVVIGCLGATGAGKSSLLNALLDESAVLPTSSSRACTAAVIELRFNEDLRNARGDTTVYKARVEFITMDEWFHELEVLLKDCCDHDTLTVGKPDSKDSLMVWDKIAQVHGNEKMDSLNGKTIDESLALLKNDAMVLEVLGGQNGQPNIVEIEKGSVNPSEAKHLCELLSDLDEELAQKQQLFSKAFREEIDEYVYRKGHSCGPQKWPLVRKCVLFGPWSVLSSGACLVDLPGVRDSNAARAKVADSYIQKCDYIWIVAPIQRAVDDKTAKDLLGEQFKKQLLMDGQYCNVRFICTQTDDCEPEEIMHDHEDVARLEEGRWEKLDHFRNEIRTILSDYKKTKAWRTKLMDLTKEVCHLDNQLQQSRNSVEDIEKLQNSIVAKKESMETLKSKMRCSVQNYEQKKPLLEKKLKVEAALVRNEYSTKRLQANFREGLDELTNKNGMANESRDTTSPLPKDFQLVVHCTSANDYLKIRNLRDGEPSTFRKSRDTQIPSLRAMVHDTTSEHRYGFARVLAMSAGSLVGNLKRSVVAEPCSQASSEILKTALNKEMTEYIAKLDSIVSKFNEETTNAVDTILHPAMKSGAAEGSKGASSGKWLSARRARDPDNPSEWSKLHYATFEAVVRRDGVYDSRTVGFIDFNQSLFDPMADKIASPWQQTMDSVVTKLLEKAEERAAKAVDESLVSLNDKYREAGVDVSSYQATVSQQCKSSIEDLFASIKSVAANRQKDLNRSFLPKVEDHMAAGYDAAQSVRCGKGRYARMKKELQKHAISGSKDLFGDTMDHVLSDVYHLIKCVGFEIKDLEETVRNQFTAAFSTSWAKRDEEDKRTREEIKNRQRGLLKMLDGLLEQHTALKYTGKAIECENIGGEKETEPAATPKEASGDFSNNVE